eukprot:GHVQ01015886.1.p1 GENE.GHVQ01015886.1~~GHVQ01015886.1.p1  ORF type:complete len:1731 (-),score=163.47 GHVQ01015886.1:195-5387(-)
MFFPGCLFLVSANDYDLDGAPCSVRRPTRTMMCPIFAISSEGKSQKEIESECDSFGFAPCIASPAGDTNPVQRFSDGVCRRCPDDFNQPVEQDGDLFCENAKGEKKTFDNPTSCLNVASASGGSVTNYRPCHSASNSPSADVEQYYKGDDLHEEHTMTACYSVLTSPDPEAHTNISQVGVTTTYNFPLLDGRSGQAPPYGFLQCPKPPATFSFTAVGFLTWYGIYAVGVIIIGSYYLLKYASERKFRTQKKYEAQQRMSNEEGQLQNSQAEALDKEGIAQSGYSDAILGLAAYVSLWILSVGLHVALLVITLDEYGMWKDTMCMNEDIQKACEGAKQELRSGWDCASGCLFSWIWTTGVHPTWPYMKNTGGIQMLYAIFLVTWVIAIVWWVTLKVLEPWTRSFFRIRCSLQEATTILCSKPAEKVIYIESDEASTVLRIVRALADLKRKIVGSPRITQACKVYVDHSQSGAEGVRYFEFQSLRYCWSPAHQQFVEHTVELPNTHEALVAQGQTGLTTAAATYRGHISGSNRIHVKIANVFVDIFHEFFDYFYLYQIFCLWIWYGFFYWLMGLSLTTVITSAGLLKVFVKRRSERQVKKMTEITTDVSVLRDGQWTKLSSEAVVPGDVIAIHPKEPVSCDCVLVSGRCVVDESSLTGEPTPVPKIPLSPMSGAKPFTRGTQADMKYTLLAGTFAESVSLDEAATQLSKGPSQKHTEADHHGYDAATAETSLAKEVRAVVLATGAQTEQGTLIRGILYPAPLAFKFDEHWRLVFLLLLCFGCLMYVGVLVLWDFSPVSIFYGVFTISQIMSPLIPAVFVAGQAKASQRLKGKQIFCVNLQRCFVAGKVKTFCFDKTGTLTLPGLEYYGVEPMELTSISNLTTATGMDSTDDDTSTAKDDAPCGDKDKMIRAFLGCCHELDLTHATHLTKDDKTTRRREARRDANSDTVDDESFWDVVYKSAHNAWQRCRSRFPWSSARERRTSVDSALIRESEYHEEELKDVTKEGRLEPSPTAATDNGQTFGPRRQPAEDDEGQDKETSCDKGMAIVGNEVDKQMFDASGFKLLSDCAKPTVRSHVSGDTYVILRRLEFDRASMTMSVIVEDLQTKERWVFCKGSYEGVEGVAKNVPALFGPTTKRLAEDGFYVLGIAFKRYEGKSDCEVPRTEVESNLRVLGLLLFRNDLKSDSKDVIMQLRAGGVDSVMITGDNALTAQKIARDATLVTADKVVLGDIANTVPNKDAKRTDDADVQWHEMGTGLSTHPVDLVDQLKAGRVQLAVTGTAFDLLSKSPASTEWLAVAGQGTGDCPSYMQALLRYTKIFARMKPDQKVSAVKLHMEKSVTGMCGDGANDAGALRVSHCGIALSSGSAQATIVAPFSTTHESLKAVPILITEGRGALATAMVGYKRLIMVGQILLSIKFFMYYFRVIVGEAWWIMIDSFMNIGMGWAILQSRPARRLRPHSPTSKLIGTETVSSVMLQVFTNWIFVMVTLVTLFHQDWFVCKEFDYNLADPARWWTMGDNYETYALSTLALFQFINTVAVFNFGFDYRVSWIRNYWPVLLWLIFLSFSTVLIFEGPSVLSCIYRYNCGDSSLLEYWSNVLDPSKFSYSGNIGAPPGCPCSEQIAFSPTCENEYNDCTAPKYNQTYHHNIIPNWYRRLHFGVIVCNCVASIFVEGFIMNGPVRRYLRQRKAARNQAGTVVQPAGLTPSALELGPFPETVGKACVASSKIEHVSD